MASVDCHSANCKKVWSFICANMWAFNTRIGNSLVHPFTVTLETPQSMSYHGFSCPTWKSVRPFYDNRVVYVVKVRSDLACHNQFVVASRSQLSFALNQLLIDEKIFNMFFSSAGSAICASVARTAKSRVFASPSAPVLSIYTVTCRRINFFPYSCRIAGSSTWICLETTTMDLCVFNGKQDVRHAFLPISLYAFWACHSRLKIFGA